MTNVPKQPDEKSADSEEASVEEINLSEYGNEDARGSSLSQRNHPIRIVVDDDGENVRSSVDGGVATKVSAGLKRRYALELFGLTDPEKVVRKLTRSTSVRLSQRPETAGQSPPTYTLYGGENDEPIQLTPKAHKYLLDQYNQRWLISDAENVKRTEANSSRMSWYRSEFERLYWNVVLAALGPVEVVLTHDYDFSSEHHEFRFLLFVFLWLIVFFVCLIMLGVRDSIEYSRKIMWDKKYPERKGSYPQELLMKTVSKSIGDFASIFIIGLGMFVNMMGGPLWLATVIAIGVFIGQSYQIAVHGKISFGRKKLKIRLRKIIPAKK